MKPREYGQNYTVKCGYCGIPPHRDPYYVDVARDEDTTPEAVAEEDGTFNPMTGRYACNACYIGLGMPSAPGPGWQVPDNTPF